MKHNNIVYIYTLIYYIHTYFHINSDGACTYIWDNRT